MDKYFLHLLEIGTKKRYNKGNILFYEGEVAKKFFIITRGMVRIYKNLSTTRELNLHCFEPFSFIAEMPAFKGEKYPASAVCEEECEICEIDFETFKNLCLRNTEFGFLLIASLFEKIGILERELLQGAMAVKNRLIRYLLENEENLKHLSQRQIASYLNIRAESLSRSIRELKESGFIATNKGKIVILDLMKLRNEIE